MLLQPFYHRYGVHINRHVRKAFRLGRLAARFGQAIEDCPYEGVINSPKLRQQRRGGIVLVTASLKRRAWRAGWNIEMTLMGGVWTLEKALERYVPQPTDKKATELEEWESDD